MKKELSSEQLIFIEATKSFFLDRNSLLYLIGKMINEKKQNLFPALVKFLNEAIIYGPIGNNYSKKMTDSCDLNFLGSIKNQQELILHYYQIAEFLCIYFNHLYRSQNYIKSYNIHFKFSLPLNNKKGGGYIGQLITLYNDKKPKDLKKGPSKSYTKKKTKSLNKDFLDSSTVYKWVSDLEKFKPLSERVSPLVQNISIEPDLKEELLKIFQELVFIHKYHKQYYLNLIKALRIIWEFENLNLRTNKSTDLIVKDLATYFICSKNNIKNILIDYRINKLKTKIIIPNTSFLLNQKETCLAEHPEYAYKEIK